MGTLLISSLDTHHSISRYVASLLAQKSHSSHHEQNASLMARSSSFFLLVQEMTAYANINDFARCQDSCSPSEVPYHCHMQGEPLKPPATRSPTQKFPSAKNLIKIPNYSFNKNSHILENGLIPPCSILLAKYIIDQR